MSRNEETVRRFIEAWSRLDAYELADFFAEDGVYHNMPAAPVVGREHIKRFVSGFLLNWSSTQWDVLNLIGRGNVVVAERLDRTKVGDRTVELPCCGVFEIADGKIAVWRDYFDMGTYLKALKG